MERCVVNVALGSWFPRGQKRLLATLRRQGYLDGVLSWTDEYPPGCPPHREVPYAFKAFALEAAHWRRYGATLWCDASCWFLRNPDPIFKRIERDGYWFWKNPGETFGECAADSTVEGLGINREESFGIPSVVTTFFGLDLQSSVGRAILKCFSTAVRDGHTRAPWGNEHDGTPWRPGMRDGFGSADPRVLACRHDQAVLSGIAHLMDLRLDDRVPARLGGYPSMPHAEDVVMLGEDDGGASLDGWERDGELKR